MPKFLKKWWITHRFYDKETNQELEFNGWINTIHNCNYKEECPEEITGSLYCELKEDGFHGTFTLDNPSLDESKLGKPKDGSTGYVIMSSVLPPDLKPHLIIGRSHDIKSFSRFDVRIEDCLDKERTYVETLKDGFSILNDILSYPYISKDEEYNKALILNNLWETAKSYKSITQNLCSIDKKLNPDYVLLSNFFNSIYFYMRFITEAFCEIELSKLKKINKSPYFVKILYDIYSNGIVSDVISNKKILNSMIRFLKDGKIPDFEDISYSKEKLYNTIMEVEEQCRSYFSINFN